jgi:hypothetical protein
MVGKKQKASSQSGNTDSIQQYMAALSDIWAASQYSTAALSRYANELLIPYLIATNYFRDVEYLQALRKPVGNTMEDYLGLWQFNFDVWQQSLTGSLDAWRRYLSMTTDRQDNGLFDTLLNGDLDGFAALAKQKARLAELLADKYPQPSMPSNPNTAFISKKATTSAWPKPIVSCFTRSRLRPRTPRPNAMPNRC